MTADQHRDPAASLASVPTRLPAAGPIAILPTDNPAFAAAVEAGGGVVGPLDGETRGLVWLSSKLPDQLAAILDENPQIGWVQLPWAGVDALADVFARYTHDTGPLFTSAKGAYSEPVAEHALALTLALLRSLPQKYAATGWGLSDVGVSLFGRNVLLVGAGGIAGEILRLTGPFRTRTTVVRRSADAVPGADRTVTADRLLDELPDADVVILAAASTAETANMFGAAEFAAMKPTAVLVNIARGALIDTDALVDALATDRIAGAGLDVTAPEPLPDGHPLWSEPRALITSHSADTSAMTTPLLAARIRANVEALLGHGRFVGIVDVEKGY
jgi:phosphoglycerate dehydrogenase-like enzyme